MARLLSIGLAFMVALGAEALCSEGDACTDVPSGDASVMLQLQGVRDRLASTAPIAEEDDEEPDEAAAARGRPWRKSTTTSATDAAPSTTKGIVTHEPKHRHRTERTTESTTAEAPSTTEDIGTHERKPAHRTKKSTEPTTTATPSTTKSVGTHEHHHRHRKTRTTESTTVEAPSTSEDIGTHEPKHPHRTKRTTESTTTAEPSTTESVGTHEHKHRHRTKRTTESTTAEAPSTTEDIGTHEPKHPHRRKRSTESTTAAAAAGLSTTESSWMDEPKHPHRTKKTTESTTAEAPSTTKSIGMHEPKRRHRTKQTTESTTPEAQSTTESSWTHEPKHRRRTNRTTESTTEEAPSTTKGIVTHKPKTTAPHRTKRTTESTTVEVPSTTNVRTQKPKSTRPHSTETSTRLSTTAAVSPPSTWTNEPKTTQAWWKTRSTTAVSTTPTTRRTTRATEATTKATTKRATTTEAKETEAPWLPACKLAHYPTIENSTYKWSIHKFWELEERKSHAGHEEIFEHNIQHHENHASHLETKWHTARFFNQQDKWARHNLRGRFVQMSSNDGEAYWLCAFETHEDLVCAVASGSMRRRLVARFIVSSSFAKTCVPAKLELVEAHGSWSLPALTAEGWKGGAVAMVWSGELHFKAHQAPEGWPIAPLPALLGGCGPNGFPALGGAKYALKSCSLGRFEGDDPLKAMASTVDYSVEFFDQKGESGLEEKCGKFVQMKLNGGLLKFLCTFEFNTGWDVFHPRFKLLCIDSKEGRFVSKFSIIGEDIDEWSRVPRRLTLDAGYGSVIIPKWLTTLGRMMMVWTGEMELDYKAMDGKVERPKDHKEKEAERKKKERISFPSMGGKKFEWYSFQFVRTGDQAEDAGTVLQRGLFAEFFDQVSSWGMHDPHGKFVQLRVWGDFPSAMTSPYYAVCAFEDEFSLLCVDSAEGLLVAHFIAVTLKQWTKLPEKLTELRYGSRPVPGTADPYGNPYRQDIVSVGHLKLSEAGLYSAPTVFRPGARHHFQVHAALCVLK